MSAIQCKDHLLSMINHAGNLEELLVVADTIITILQNTEGLWQELSYCYKASEIAQRLVTEFVFFERDGVLHYKTLKKVEEKRKVLTKLADHYHSLK